LVISLPRLARRVALSTCCLRRGSCERVQALAGSILQLPLERDDFSSNRHPALASYLSMIFSENRCTLFGIML
jgi:hypothetical protein